MVFFDGDCAVCGRSLAIVCQRCEATLCPAEMLQLGGLDLVRAGYCLDASMRSIIVAYKYRRRRRLAGWLASRLAPLVPRAADCIGWIPATPQRRRQRGYDQSKELATTLGLITQVPTLALFDRANGDVRQTELGRKQRMSGPALALRRSPPSFVVLVDDVLTTGASMQRAAALLRQAGTQRVIALAAAATPLPPPVRARDHGNASIIHPWK